jgi:hypothetical protein
MYLHYTGDSPVAFCMEEYRVCERPGRPLLAIRGRLLNVPAVWSTSKLAHDMALIFQHWMTSGDFQVSMRELVFGTGVRTDSPPRALES